MKFFPRGSAQQFQREVAAALWLPEDCSPKKIRKALKLKGQDYLDWYDNRLAAIANALSDDAVETGTRSRGQTPLTH